MSIDPHVEAGLLDLSTDNAIAQWGLQALPLHWTTSFDEKLPQATVDTGAAALPLGHGSELPCFINALPAELLVAVFNLLTTDTVDTRMSWYASPAWIRITHVCARWRALCIATPTLWTRISFAHSDLTTAMCIRARDTPLSIAYGERGFYHKATPLMTVLSRRPAVARLDLQMTTRFAVDLDESLAKITPSLEHIKLSILGQTTAPNFMATRSAPLLRHLELDGAVMHPGARLITSESSLERLVLSGFPRSHRWHIEDALLVLQRTPSLRVLFLSDVLRGQDDSSSSEADELSSYPMIALPKMCNLQLNSQTSAIASLLAHLSLPPDTTYYSIVCKARTREDCAISACVPRTLRIGAKVTRIEVQIRITELTVAFYTGISRGAYSTSPLVLHLRPERALAHSCNSGREAIQDLLSGKVDFSGVLFLSFDCDDVLDAAEIDQVLSWFSDGMPQLKEVMLLSHAARHVLSAGIGGEVVLASGHFARTKRVCVPFEDAKSEATAITAVRARFGAVEVIEGYSWTWRAANAIANSKESTKNSIRVVD